MKKIKEQKADSGTSSKGIAKPNVVRRFLCFLGVHKWKIEGGGCPQWWINERVCIYCKKIHNDD